MGRPVITLANFPWDSVPTLHISYHLGRHYNSVRLQEDMMDGLAMPIGHQLKLVDYSSFNDRGLFLSQETTQKDGPG